MFPLRYSEAEKKIRKTDLPTTMWDTKSDRVRFC